MSKENEDIIFQGKTEHIFKVVIIGDPAVGKTSLLTKYSSKQFQEKYLPTIGTNITKVKMDIENTELNLMMWDIAGQSHFYMLHKPYFNGGNAMMLVFDITRTSTYSNINNWYNTAVKYGLSRVPRILIGNKIDLNNERKITRAHAQHLSDKLNAPYFETSAKTGENVNEVFQKIGELLLKSQNIS